MILTPQDIKAIEEAARDLVKILTPEDLISLELPDSAAAMQALQAAVFNLSRAKGEQPPPKRPKMSEAEMKAALPSVDSLTGHEGEQPPEQPCPEARELLDRAENYVAVQAKMPGGPVALLAEIRTFLSCQPNQGEEGSE